MCSLIFVLTYTNDLLKYNYCSIKKKHASREVLSTMLFIKKIYIYKEKSGTVTKVKLVNKV